MIETTPARSLPPAPGGGDGLALRDLIEPALCGLGAVVVMGATAAAGLRLAGIAPTGPDGAAAVGLVVAGAVGGTAGLGLDVSLGPFPIALTGQARAVPVVVTVAGMLALAVAFRAALLHRAPRDALLAVRVGVAVLATATVTALVAAQGQLRIALPRRLPLGDGILGGGSGSPGGGAGLQVDGGVTVVASTGRAFAGALLLSLVTLTCVALRVRGTGRRRGPAGDRAVPAPVPPAPVLPAPSVALAVLLVLALLVPALLPARGSGAVGVILLVAVPSLLLAVVSSAAGVPWTVQLPASGSPSSLLPSSLLPASVLPGHGAGLPGGRGWGGGLPDGWLGGVRVALLVVVLLVVVARGLVLGRRGRGPGGAAARAARYGAAGAVGLALITWLGSAGATVRGPFAGGDLGSLGVTGDVAAATLIGLAWGLVAAVLVTAIARRRTGLPRRPGRILDPLGRPAGQSPGRAGVGDGRLHGR